MDPIDSNNRSWFSWPSPSTNGYLARLTSCFQRSVSKNTQTNTEPSSSKTKYTFPIFSKTLRTIISLFFQTWSPQRNSSTNSSDVESFTFMFSPNSTNKNIFYSDTNSDTNDDNEQIITSAKKNLTPPPFPDIASSYFDVVPNDVDETSLNILDTQLTKTLQKYPPWIKNLIKDGVKNLVEDNQRNEPINVECSFNPEGKCNITITSSTKEARIKNLPNICPEKPVEFAVFFRNKASDSKDY